MVTVYSSHSHGKEIYIVQIRIIELCWSHILFILIVVTSSERYFSYIQDGNKFNNMKKKLYSRVCVTWSLVLCVCYVDRCLTFCSFSFGHCVVCSSSIYGFWLSLWYIQTFLWMDVDDCVLRVGRRFLQLRCRLAHTQKL